MVILQNSQVFVVGSPLAGALTKILLMRQATNPMMKKLITAFARWPIAKLNFQRGSTYVAHSPLGCATATIGMMASLTIAFTTSLSATPITTATANPMAFCLIRNDLNSFHIRTSSLWVGQLECGGAGSGDEHLRRRPRVGER